MDAIIEEKGGGLHMKLFESKEEQFETGNKYYYGKGVPKDYHEALK